MLQLRCYIILGLLIGSPLGGLMGDALGRRNSFYLAAFILCPAVALAGLIEDFYTFAFLK